MPINDLDRALLSDPDRFRRFVALDDAMNLAKRESVADTIEPRDTSEMERTEPLVRMLDFIERENKIQTSPINLVKREPKKVDKGYFAETVLPDAARYVAETINDGIMGFYFMTGLTSIPLSEQERAEGQDKFIPRIDVAPKSEGPGFLDVSVSKTSMAEKVDEFKQTGEALGGMAEGLIDNTGETIQKIIQFAEDAPVSTAAMALPLLIGGTARLSSLRNVRTVLPKYSGRFLGDAARVLKGDINYAHVHLSESLDNFSTIKDGLARLRKEARAKGKVVTVIKSLDPDLPGLNAAIYDPEKMKRAMQGFGIGAKNDKAVNKFVRQGLHGPERYETDFYKGLLEPLREGNTVIVRDIPGRKSMKFGDALRSPQRVLSRVHPEMGNIGRRARELLTKQRLDTESFRLARDDYFDVVEAKIGNETFGKAVSELDQRAVKMGDKFDLDTEVAKLPSDMREGVKRHKELFDHLRDLVTEERIASGVPEELARNWAKSGFYFTKLFKGNFRIMGKAKGTNALKQLDRATTEGEAYQALKRLGKDGATDLDIEFDNVIPTEVMGRLPRKKLMQLFNVMSENSGIDMSEMMEYARKNGIPVVGAKESKKRNLKYANKRQMVDGQEFEYTNFDYRGVTDAYVNGVSRYLAMSQWRREYNALKGKVPSQMTKAHEYLERFNAGIEGRRFETSERWDDMVQGIAGKLNKGLKASGVGFRFDPQPYQMERLSGLVRSVQANLKLGTPRAVAINALQTAQTLYPRVGERVFWKAWRDSFSDDVVQRAMDAGVGHMRTTVDVGGRSLSAKAGLGTTLKESKLLYGFTKQEVKNRVVAFRAGELEAMSPKGRYVAKKLGMNPKDPDFVRQYAIDMVSRTQFDLSPADMPRWMQHPVTQSLFQFKPFQLKYLEAIADLRNQPDALKAYGRFAATLTAAGGVKSISSPTAIATSFGIWKGYQELRDSAGEETANLMMYGIPGLLGMDLSNSLNIDLVPSFGSTTEEKIINFLGGPALSDVIDMVEFSGLEKKDQDAVFSYLKKLVPQIKWGANIWSAIQEDKWLRDNRGNRIARADAVDRWLEGLSFSSVNRGLANTAKYEIDDRELSRRIRRFARQ